MIYIGVHQTDNKDDSYLGSGDRLRHAIKKHGRHVFIKEIIQEFPDREKMLEAEAAMVDREFVRRKDTYNIRLGGTAGFKGVSPPPYDHRKSWTVSRKKEVSERYTGKRNPFYGKTHSEATRKILSLKCGRVGEENGFKGKKHSLETKEILSKKAKRRPSQNPLPKFLGSTNRFAKKYLICDPNGKEYEILCRKEFCEQHDLCPNVMKRYTNKGKILKFERPYRMTDKGRACVGWSIEQVDDRGEI